MYETCYTHSPVPCKLHDGKHDADEEANNNERAFRLLTARLKFNESADQLAAELKSLGYSGADIVNYFMHWAERWSGNG